jgi:hypothetical protein
VVATTPRSEGSVDPELAGSDDAESDEDGEQEKLLHEPSP